LEEVLLDDSKLAFSQSRQKLTREPETPSPFRPCLGQFLCGKTEKLGHAAAGLTAAKNVSGL